MVREIEVSNLGVSDIFPGTWIRKLSLFFLPHVEIDKPACSLVFRIIGYLWIAQLLYMPRKIFEINS